jgi:hypothetical protein
VHTSLRYKTSNVLLDLQFLPKTWNSALSANVEALNA